ncbi:UNVERIFIED_CONTAM: Inositol 1,4,5-trisphosphate receptor type 1, partial [Gekko kuhli]
LFDLVYREETLLNVIKSVTRNGRSIILTAVLALILVYLFSIVGYLFFKDDFILEVDKLPNETSLPDQHTETGEKMTREFLYSDVCRIANGENCSSVVPSAAVSQPRNLMFQFYQKAHAYIRGTRASACQRITPPARLGTLLSSSAPLLPPLSPAAATVEGPRAGRRQKRGSRAAEECAEPGWWRDLLASADPGPSDELISAEAEEEDKEHTCETLLMCIVTVLSHGLRSGGGVGDVLRKPSKEEPLFAARVIYDLLFFFMVIIIVLNLIFGVIIDTFADLRSLERDKFDNKTVTFEEHIKEEHNMWHYLFFIVLVKVKDSTEYTGPESYVAEMIKKKITTVHSKLGEQ